MSLDADKSGQSADWEPRRQLTLEAARKQSERVRRWRQAFAIAAGLAFAVLISFVIIHTLAQVAAPAPTFSAEDGARIVSPRYAGRDTGGKSYGLTAKEASRTGPADSALAELIAPAWKTEDGITAQGKRGVWDPKNQSLELYDDVKFATKDGSTFTSTRATVIAAENRIVGVAPLEGQMRLGFVRSDAYEIIDGGKRVRLSGRVRAVMRSDIKPEPAPILPPTTPPAIGNP